MQKAVINLETLSCPSCLQKIENALRGLEGVEKESVEILFNSSRVRANFNSESITIEKIEKSIEDLGYPVIRSKVRSEEHTSELQSRGHLVCRLLLEKKKTTESTTTSA